MTIVSYALYAASAAAALVTLFAVQKQRAAKKRTSLPPGPKGLPVLGNVLDFASDKAWLTFDKWFKQYGDLVYVSLLGKPAVLLGSYEACTELLETRGAVYSSRLPSIMFEKLMGCGELMFFQPYGEGWKRSRRILHPHIHPNAIAQYREIQETAARTFTLAVLETEPSPAILSDLIRMDFAATILKIVYGISIKTKDEKDVYISVPNKLTEMIVEAGTPGRFFVDGLDFLQYVPAWVPGAGFQAFGKQARDLLHRSREEPMKVVRAQMAKGTAPPSMVRGMLEDTPPDDQQAQETIRDLGVTTLQAGSDTTVASVLTFFLAMLHYPEVQKDGRAEIDAVLGGRLPTLDDKDSLPYVTATMLEVLRWLPATPIGVPHYTSADDTYKGHFIPQGTMVFGVAWSLLHDSAVYDQPESFLPQRFLRPTPTGAQELDPTVRDPRSAAFGFGRRICPGKHLAEQGLWIIIATILATIDVLPALDKDGKDIIPPISLRPGGVSHPTPFPYRVRPRSTKSINLLRENFD